MDISLFRRFWHDTHLNAVRLYLKDPARVPQVQARLQEPATATATASWPCPTGISGTAS